MDEKKNLNNKEPGERGEYRKTNFKANEIQNCL